MGDLILEAAKEEKDLGVIIDEKLKFDKHTEAQVNKANKVLGLLRRSFETLDKETLVWLFKALVRPHLEYCNLSLGHLLSSNVLSVLLDLAYGTVFH